MEEQERQTAPCFERVRRRRKRLVVQFQTMRMSLSLQQQRQSSVRPTRQTRCRCRCWSRPRRMQALQACWLQHSRIRQSLEQQQQQQQQRQQGPATRLGWLILLLLRRRRPRRDRRRRQAALQRELTFQRCSRTRKWAWMRVLYRWRVRRIHHWELALRTRSQRELGKRGMAVSRGYSSAGGFSIGSAPSHLAFHLQLAVEAFQS